MTDTGGFSPSLNFITPFNSTGSFNRTWSIGGSLSGIREHTGTYAYAINFAQLWDRRTNIDCNKSSSYGGLEGDLDLITDTTQGLLSLDKIASTNITASASPILPSSNILIDSKSPLTLTFTDTDADSLKLSLYGGITVSVPTAGYQGAITFSGSGTADDTNARVSTLGFGREQFKYFVSVTGSTFQNIDGDKADRNTVSFSMSGNLTQSSPTQYKSELGFTPKLTLYGYISLTTHPYKIYVKSALLSSDATSGGGRIATASANTTPAPINPTPPAANTPAPAPAKTPAPAPTNTAAPAPAQTPAPAPTNTTAPAPAQTPAPAPTNTPAPAPTNTAAPAPAQTPAPAPTAKPIIMQLGSAPPPGVFQPRAGTGTSGPGTSGKGAPGGLSSSGSATQFSSFENFQITYGLNGGPTWTLVNFKGPVGGGSGGSAGGGGLLSMVAPIPTSYPSLSLLLANREGRICWRAADLLGHDPRL